MPWRSPDRGRFTPTLTRLFFCSDNVFLCSDKKNYTK
jgi:hypothetical protein